MAAPFPFVGEIASLSAALIWAVCMCVIRSQGSGLHPQTLNFFKCTVGAFFMFLTLLFTGFDIPSARGLSLLATSGVIGLVLGDTALFASLMRLGAPLTSAVQCLGPPFAATLAWIFLGESLTQVEWMGLGLTLAAVVSAIFFARPYLKLTGGQQGNQEFGWGIFYGVLSALANAGGIVIIRQEIQKIDAMSGTFIRIFPAVLILGMILLRKERRLELKRILQHPLPLATAAFGGTFLGVFLMSVGAKFAKAGVTTALTSTYPIWIIPIASVTLGEKVGWRSILCIIAAVVGVALLF